MGLISQAQLQACHEVVSQALVDRCEIQRMTGVISPRGTQYETWSTIAVDIPCRLENYRVMARTDVENDREVTKSPWTIFFEYDTNVQRDDQIIIAGETYKIIDVNPQLEVTPQKEALATHLQ